MARSESPASPKSLLGLSDATWPGSRRALRSCSLCRYPVSSSSSALASPRRSPRITGRAAGGPGRRTVREAIERASSALQQLYADLDARLLTLGDGHSVKLRQYVAYRHRSNFACVKVLPAADALLVFLRVDPKSIPLEAGFSRDVTDIGHHGSGSVELRIASARDLERAAPLLRASYAAA